MAENYPKLELTPKQKQVYEFLKTSSRDSEYFIYKWYLGALYVLDNPHNPDRFSQAANSLRELMEKLLMLGLNNTKKRLRNEEHIKDFYRKNDPGFDVLPDSLQKEITKKYYKLRQKLEIITHHNTQINPVTESRFNENISRLEEILIRLDLSYVKEERVEIRRSIKKYQDGNEE